MHYIMIPQAIFTELEKRLQAAEIDNQSSPPPIFILDCSDASNPRHLATYLSNLMLRSIKTTVTGGKGDLKKADEVDALVLSKLDCIFHSYLQFFETFRYSPRKPIIVIDNAHLLMLWREAGPKCSELDELLSFLVRVTKEERLAHVVIATSEYYLVH